MNVSDQFMVGARYMVAPIVAPRIGANTTHTTRSVYFPKHRGQGTAGFRHFFTGEVYPAGATVPVTIASNLTEFPLFVVLDQM